MSKHGKIAEGMSRLSALIPKHDKETLRVAAKKANRSLSNFIRDELEKIAKQKRVDEVNRLTEMAGSSPRNGLDDLKKVVDEKKGKRSRGGSA